jgi:YjbE family integral membrane protein
MSVPYLKLVGSALLLWIGVKLMVPEHDDGKEGKDAPSHIWGAVRTIIIADAVMSLDNAIAIAAAAKNDYLLITIGLLISIPLIIFGSQLILKVMGRFPVIITAGAALIGWIAGDVGITDPAVAPLVEGYGHWPDYAAKIVGAAFVVVLGKWIATRTERKHKHAADLETGN